MQKLSPATMADSPELSLLPSPPSPNPRKRKTSVLPNLSDCHSCNNRIDTKNPKNRLQILTSEWRIVLLCNSCHNLVESSQSCSYCLTDVFSSSIESIFECKICHRRIHMSCVQKFSLCLDNGNNFSICFDCWIPNLLVNEYNRVRGNRTRKKVKLCENSTCIWSSRVCDELNRGMVNEANVVAQKKIAFAISAKAKAAAKAVVARKAIELASVLSVAVDSKLVMRLNRAINRSPRIARDLCLSNTYSNNVATFGKLAIDKVGGDAGIVDTDSMSCGELNGTETKQDCMQMTSGIQDEKCSPMMARNLCLSNTYSMNVASFGKSVIADVGGDASIMDCMQMNCGIQNEKCSRDANDCLITYSRKGRAWQDGRREEAHNNCPFRICTRRRAHVENDCFRTYSWRPLTTLFGKNRLQYGTFNFEHGVLTSAIDLNCCKESRALTNAS